MLSFIAPQDLSSPSNVGFVVKDADKTAEFFSSFGIGPWQSFEFAPPEETLTLAKCKPFHLHIQWARVSGDLVLEVIEPVDGESLWAKFLVDKGGGLQHIAFRVSNFSEMVSKLKEQGGSILVGGHLPVFNGKRWIYMETKPDGLIVELVEDDLHDLAFPRT